MHLLPYDHLTLRTESPPDVVQARLAAMVSTAGFSLGTPAEPFRGEIAGRHFKISPVPGWLNRNSFRPVVVGDIVPVPGGTEVRVTMRLNAFVLAFLLFWFGGVLSGGVAAIAALLGAGGGGARGQSPGIGLTFPLGMAVFAYGLVSVGFWPEAKKARRLLREGLGCREEDAPNRLVRT